MSESEIDALFCPSAPSLLLRLPRRHVLIHTPPRAHFLFRFLQETLRVFGLALGEHLETILHVHVFFKTPAWALANRALLKKACSARTHWLFSRK